MNAPLMKYSGLTLGLMFSASVLAGNPDTGGGDTGTGFPGVSNFASSGPFATTSGNEGPSCRIYRPRTLGAEGRDHPIIIWGNGTGSTPSTYGSLLEHWASHGFVVAAARTSNAGSGREMIACLDYLVEQNGRSFGTYSGNLNVNRVATAGHSQGGGGSIMAGQDSRITVTAPFQPYTIGLGHRSSSQSNQNGPMFLMTGGSDVIASPSLNAAPVFNRANVPVFWGERTSASHFEPVGNGGDYRGPSTAWMRFHLMDDQSAESTFYGSRCDLCTDYRWDVRRKGIN
ncbi:Chlorophyllase enzyme [Halopseudomonas xinjiangensis]|uniref:Chlorophyllase enzyme n=1 Tax=Halopseudomonas xinjiangensis TaxID=487184 RepID=A0A1H1SPR7_9GAMM|nr:alpha/beta hydrolase [Halopseudomonas xinjiangensis]SDS50007.1 Chlorophyllase enzyme [Halopseudomonas xinjiangensis]